MRRRPAVGAELRRPAAAWPTGGRRALRKPAAADEAEATEPREEEQEAVSVEEKFKRGDITEGVKLAPGGYKPNDWVVATEGAYYKQKVAFAAKVKREKEEKKSRGEREPPGKGCVRSKEVAREISGEHLPGSGG